jgi:two-component system, OmpR family, phosphate regulon sensor histidine kinase PhoR
VTIRSPKHQEQPLEFASPQAVAALLKRDKQLLLAEWEAAARRLLGADRLSPEALRDHMPFLIDELARELERPSGEERRLQMFCAHGEHRLTMGIHIAQVIDEYRLLRSCIVGHLERAGLALVGDANRWVHHIIDEGVRASVETYINRRDAEEKKQREEYLKFIVHDLRSPLSAIYYAILLIERELSDASVSERVRATQAAIKRNIERMQGLIVKLLQQEDNLCTDPELRAHRSIGNLRPIVESAIRTLAPLSVSAATRVENQVSPELMIHADPELLERLFQNLVANAIEHTPRGAVRIGAAARDDGAVEIWISDNGRGIPPDLRARIFEKYQTERPGNDGVGLGLSVVKRIVDAHGGDIALESAPHQGTTFRLHIPGR